MSRQLILLRHAKASWGAANEDVARELNQTGVAEAKAVGEWLKTHGIRPDVVICSSARRTVQTWENLVKPAGFAPANIQFEQNLYLAELAVLTAQLKNLAQFYQTIMLIGHNPGLEELATYVSNIILPRTFAGELLATANLLLFTLPDDWADLAAQGELLHVFRPEV